VNVRYWTRPPAGARLALGLLLAAGPAAAAAPAGPLPWRAGGRVGITVDAAAFPDSAGTTLDVYVRVPPGTLAMLSRDSLGMGRLRLTASLRGAYGGAQSRELVQEFGIEPADSAWGMGRVVGLRFPARPGLLRLSVRVDDLLSRKGGLAYAGRRVPESTRLEGEVRVAPVEAGRQLSDPEFVWAVHAGGRGTTFERGGYTVLPNPERLYGLFAPEMRATFAARAAAERPWRWEARVLDGTGRVVASRESTGAASRELRGLVAVDVSTEPAGGYDLELKVWQEGDAAPVVRRARFSVAWRVESWLRNPRDVEDEAHFLLEAGDEETFAALSPGEQERFLEDFWRERDPSPGTGVNEARVTFLRRVERANQLYTRTGLGKGMFSDMGRVYIRYGEPSEVVNQVIPTGSETVDELVEELAANEERAVGDIQLKGPGADPRPFELWIYEGPVLPPPYADPEVSGRERRRRILFLFVDQLSTGDYRLRYTTE
jgi:GWxTD domain-containing protein